MNHLNEQELREQPLLSEEGIKTHMALMPEYLNKATYERATRKLIAAYEADRKSNRELVQMLVDKADALVKRWDSPLWKDLPHTAEYINELRYALAAIAATKGITPTTRADVPMTCVATFTRDQFTVIP